MRDVLCFGTIVLDYVLVVDKLPKPNENCFVKSMRITYGGAAANVAVNLANLGKDSGINAVVGKDFHETGYEHYLVEKGIDLSLVFRREDILLPRCFLVSKNDDQMIFYYEVFEKVRETLMKNIDKIIKYCTHYKVLHFSTGHYTFYKKILEKLHSNKKLIISYDPGQGIFEDTKNAIEIIPYVDILFINDHEKKKILEVLKLKHIWELKGPKIIVVSLGERGSKIYFRDHIISVPIAKPKKVVDPTGCGDAHRAGFLFKLLEFCENKDEIDNLSRSELELCGKFASVVSSFIIEKEGAQTNSPTLEEVEKRFKENFG